jgi:ribosome-binding protein aMBF1 (putative translation factor)
MYKTVVLCDFCLDSEIETIGETIPAVINGEPGEFHACPECRKEILKRFHKNERVIEPSPSKAAPMPVPKPRAEIPPAQGTGRKFHKLIMAELVHRGWTISKLAATKQVSYATLTGWSNDSWKPSEEAVSRLTRYLNLDRGQVFEATGVRVPGTPAPKAIEKKEKKEPEYPYSTFYDYVEEKVRLRGYASIWDFAAEYSLAPSTIDSLKKRLPRGMTLQILAKYLKVEVEDALKVYVALKNKGAEESEKLDLEPVKQPVVKAVCLTCSPHTTHETRNRTTHARNKHGVDPWEVKWELTGVTEVIPCPWCDMPFQSAEALQGHAARTDHHEDRSK